MKMNRKVLYIGRFLSPRLVDKVLKDKKGYNFSSHNFESLLIDGLNQIEGLEVNLLSLPAIGYFPGRQNEWKIGKHDFLWEDNISAHSVGFLNLPFLKKIWMIWNGWRYARRILINNPPVNTVIISAADLTVVTVGWLLKKQVKNLHITLILPDLPGFMLNLDKSLSCILKVYDRLEAFLLSKMLYRFDSFVLLTYQMGQKLKLDEKHKPYIVMEGLVGNQSLEEKEKREFARAILYTGTLREKFGILNLLKAFEKLDIDDVELWICGSGEAEEFIKKQAYSDKRIKFFGLLAPCKTIELQQRAAILVNPRTSEGEYTMYSFPSKIMEYLASGTPVIMNKLPGIPEEYFGYTFIPDNESVEALANKIQEVMLMSAEARKRIGGQARYFVYTYKNNEIQAKRILDMSISS